MKKLTINRNDWTGRNGFIKTYKDPEKFLISWDGKYYEQFRLVEKRLSDNSYSAKVFENEPSIQNSEFPVVVVMMAENGNYLAFAEDISEDSLNREDKDVYCAVAQVLFNIR